jgi:hypothetical protein
VKQQVSKTFAECIHKIQTIIASNVREKGKSDEFENFYGKMGQNSIEMKGSKLQLYAKWISKHLIKSGQYLNHFISS